MMGYIYILLTLLLTVYGQLILKWRINFHGSFPEQLNLQLVYLGKALLDPYIISSFAAAFLASLTWIAALTKFDISYAYPFMSLSFLMVLVLGYFFFNEPITLFKIIGIVLILIGVYFASR